MELDYIDRVRQLQFFNIVDRHIRDRSNPMESFSNEEFRRRFRFTKEIVIILFNFCAAPLINFNRRGLPVPPFLQFLAALRFYSSGSFQLVYADICGLSQPTISRIIQRVSSAIASKSREMMKFPSTENATARHQNAFYQIAHFPGVIGCIDCTHVKIVKPVGPNAGLFINRKGFFSINVQAICAANLQLTNVVCRWYGSAHDSRIFDNSEVCAKFENHEYEGILLGDNGYPCRRYLLTPILNPSTEPERRYNRAQIKTRNTVERAFGVWKRRFPCLHLELRTKLETTLRIIVATAVLHNFAISHDIPLNDDDAHPEGEDPNVANRPHPNVDNAVGIALRRTIIQNHFS